MLTLPKVLILWVRQQWHDAITRFSVAILREDLSLDPILPFLSVNCIFSSVSSLFYSSGKPLSGQSNTTEELVFYEKIH